MDLARPYSALSPTLEGDVVAVLARTARGLTGREVARLASRGSQRGVLSALNRLVDQGLVSRGDAGQSFLYALNREHLAAPAVETLSGMRSELFERLRTLVAEWEPKPAHVSVFGSAARGVGGIDSDIDLLVVCPRDLDPEDPDWRGNLDGLADNVERWTGNHAAIAEISERDVRRLSRTQPRIVHDLRSDAVTLAGPEIPELLGPV